jgi:hypothetical protein
LRVFSDDSVGVKDVRVVLDISVDVSCVISVSNIGIGDSDTSRSVFEDIFSRVFVIWVVVVVGEDVCSIVFEVNCNVTVGFIFWDVVISVIDSVDIDANVVSIFDGIVAVDVEDFFLSSVVVLLWDFNLVELLDFVRTSGTVILLDTIVVTVSNVDMVEEVIIDVDDVWIEDMGVVVSGIALVIVVT